MVVNGIRVSRYQCNTGSIKSLLPSIQVQVCNSLLYEEPGYVRFCDKIGLALEVRAIWISLSQELEKVRREVLGLGEEPLGLNTPTNSTGLLDSRPDGKVVWSTDSTFHFLLASKFIHSRYSKTTHPLRFFIFAAKIQACAASDSTWPIFPGVDLYVCYVCFPSLFFWNEKLFGSIFFCVYFFFSFFIQCFCAFCLSAALSVALEIWIFKRRRSTRDFSKCWKLGCAECESLLVVNLLLHR